jgi:hypothetical protein
MLYREILADYSNIPKKHNKNNFMASVIIDKVNTSLLSWKCRQFSEDFLNLKPKTQIRRKIYSDRHFNFLTTRNIKTMIFWDVTQCVRVGRYQNFEGVFCFKLQGRF